MPDITPNEHSFKSEKEVILAVKILIKRQFKADTVGKASALLNKIRFDAMNLPGYISGETWVNHYDPCKITVVSTWQTVEDWIRWEESDERAANEEKLEGLLVARTKFEVYDLGKSSAK
jgi:heme-degrading monooxygenase HmoA